MKNYHEICDRKSSLVGENCKIRYRDDYEPDEESSQTSASVRSTAVGKKKLSSMQIPYAYVTWIWVQQSSHI